MSNLKGVPKRVAITEDLRSYPDELVNYAEFIVRDGRVIKDRHGVCREALAEELDVCKRLTPAQAKLALEESAWRGTKPAEGTRRQVIFDELLRADVLSDTEALDFADSIESALLREGFAPLRDNPHLSAASRALVEDQLRFLDKRHGAPASRVEEVDPVFPRDLSGLVSGGSRPAWAGSPPAEGTRRALIHAALKGASLSYEFNRNTTLHFADAVESALLKAAIYDDGREADAQEAINAVGQALNRIDAPQGATFAERIDRLYRELARPSLIPSPIHKQLDRVGIRRTDPGEGPERILTLAERVEALIRRYQAQQHATDGVADLAVAQAEQLAFACRDDAWVSEVAHQAGGAVSGVFLRDDPEKVMPAEECAAAVATILADFGVKAPGDHVAEESLEFGKHETSDRRPKPSEEFDAATRKFLEGEVERLLGGREEARSGESRYAEERDCAFALLRWLLPVTVAKRLED